MKKRMVITMLLVSLLTALLGCGKEVQYDADDIRSVSISCGHMDDSFSYSFYLRKEGEVWLLDAEYAKDTESPRVEFEECELEEEDAEDFLKLVQEENAIETLQRYKKRKRKTLVLDETRYYSMIGFADGESFGAEILVSREIEAAFYRLAEKYAG